MVSSKPNDISSLTNQVSLGLPRQLANLIVSAGLFWLSIAFIWLVLSGQNFHYGVWYQQLDIAQTIERFAPQNRFNKRNFAATDAAQHQQLFAEIVSAIHQNGEGLADIEYRVGTQSVSLLTAAEVQHLQDVAELIDWGKRVSLVILFFTLITLVFMFVKRIEPINLRWHVAFVVTVLFVLGVAVVLIGPTEVFYWLHIQVFPKDHQWFFYYQDSLMATLMRAPVLFAPIAVVWVVLSVFLWCALLLCLNTLLKRFHHR